MVVCELWRVYTKLNGGKSRPATDRGYSARERQTNLSRDKTCRGQRHWNSNAVCSVKTRKPYQPPGANIALKINSKPGGINHVIDPGKKSSVFREPVIIFGTDLTHPSLNENGIPSIAAVAASMDANATKYCARVRAQNHRNGKGAQEMINDLAEIVKELLIEFYRARSSSTGTESVRVSLYYA